MTLKCARGYVDCDNCDMHRRGLCSCYAEPSSITEKIAAQTPLVSDHALAAAELLQQVVDRLQAGVPPEDLGPDVQRFGRMMERKI